VKKIGWRVKYSDVNKTVTIKTKTKTKTLTLKTKADAYATKTKKNTLVRVQHEMHESVMLTRQ